MRVNGEETSLTKQTLTLLALLLLRGYDPQRIAVERNGEIVPRIKFSETLLSEDDKIEIVALVGGG